jgi:hypothetical protein
MNLRRWRVVLCAVLLAGGSTFVGPPALAAGSPLTWAAPVRIDHQPPFTGAFLSGLSCPTTGLCVAVDTNGNVITSTNPTGGAAAWTVTHVDGVNPILAVSCPTTSFCVAVDEAGDVITSTNPTGGAAAWTVANVGTAMGAVSCPSSVLCVALDFSGDVVTSTNPTGGPSAWTASNIGSGTLNFLDGISCPASNLCVAVDQYGNVITSTDPTGGSAAWTTTNVSGLNGMYSVSCPTSSLCVAGDANGDVVTSTNPTGGAGAWTVTTVDASNGLFSVSCSSSALCAAVDYRGTVVTSTDPTGGAAAWTAVNVDGTHRLFGVSCPSTSLCVAVDDVGNVVTSTDPTGGAAAWTVTSVDGTDSLTGVSCPSSALCVAVDATGHVVTTTNPIGGAAAWSAALVDMGSGLNGVSCSGTALCVAVDGGGNVVTSTNPTGGAGAWTLTHVDSAAYPLLSGVSCPTTSLCIAVDESGNVVTSTNPTGGAAAWTVTPAGTDAGSILYGVSCPTTGLCVAVDGNRNVVTSTNPTGGAAAWTVTQVDSQPQGYLVGVSCPTINFCAAVAAVGDVVTSTNPTGGTAAWTQINVESPPFTILNGISCPSSGLCVIVDRGGNVFTSTDPTGGAAAWTRTNVNLYSLSAVSCPGSGLCVAVDIVGNAVVGSLGTTTALVSSSNPSTVGSNVTYTATVSPTPDGGTVAFTDNAASISGCGAVAVNTTTGKASCITSYSATGSRAIVATYSGDASFTTSSGSLTQTVNAAVVAKAVLPAVSNGAYGGYTTAATVQNTGSAPASVHITYYDQSGAPVGAGDAINNLPVNASWTVPQDNGNSFPSSGGDAAQAGSAIVYSDQPVAVFVNEFAPGNVGDASSYSGVQIASGVGTTLYAPAIANNAYGGYTTGIGLLNEGSSPTDVTLTYRDSTGAIVKTKTVSALAAHAYQGLFSGDTSLALPNGFAGTATIASSGQPLGAIVNETGPGGQFSSYDAVPAGSTTLNAPVALRNAFGGFNTGMGIVNTTGTAGSVTITYYNASGTPTIKPFNIPANGYLGVYQGTDIPTDGAYTAKITSSVAIAAIVNEVASSSGSAQQSTSYNTYSAGSATLHLPLVENAGTDPWNTGEGIMNTGAGSITVTVNYYNTATGASVGSPQTQTLAANAFWGLYQPTGGLPTGTRATAVITTSSGGQVAVICNESSLTTFMSYDGQ